MTLFDWILVVALATLLPLYGVWSYRRLVASQAAGDRTARLRFYKITVIEEWAFAALAVLAWFGAGRSAETFGFTSGLDSGGWVAPVVTAIGVVALVALAIQWRMVSSKPSSLAEVRNQMESLTPLMPHDEQEGRWFSVVAVSAGVCEEIVYRGFLMGVLTLVTGSGVLALFGSAVVFALAHLYQGPAGGIRSGVVGLILGFVFLTTGSLLIPILLHAVLDLTSGSLARRALAVEA